MIVSGGDGTINEALQGLVGRRVRLAIWPRGTANVVGRELQLPRQIERLADIVAAGETRRIHVGCATIENTGERRYFLLMAGIGIDAAIVDCVRPALKKRVGEAAFWYSGLETFARWKPKRFFVEVEALSCVLRRRALSERAYRHKWMARSSAACLWRSASRLIRLKWW